MRPYHLLLVLLLSCSLGVSLHAEEAQTFVWWEGEAFAATNLPDPVDMKQPGNRLPEQQARLSEGRWLTGQGARASETPYFVSYSVEVPTSTTYQFWVRKFWHHGPFRWRFGDEDWRVCDRRSLQDATSIAPSWVANWVHLGEVTLEAGTHDFRIEFVRDTAGGAIDNWLLIDGPFVPRGKLKPGVKAGLADDGWFAWEPDADRLSDNSPIDLRHLNETRAGQSGFVRRNADGDGFVLGDGSPVRFVRSLTGGDSRELLHKQARRLAKYGVNLARVGIGKPYNHGPRLVRDDPKALAKIVDRMQYMVYAFREQGIYSWLDLYWTTGDHDLFFDPEWRGDYLAYIRALMQQPNPYTGVPLAEDPAVALLTIQNENNLLFNTFAPQRMQEATRARIERAFGDWLEQEYGSLAAAREAWGPDRYPHTIKMYRDAGPDDWDAGRIRLYAIAHLTGADWAVAQRNPQRAGDQLRFMTEAQQGFYAETIRVFREDFGIRSLIACSNWKTADGRLLDALEHHSYRPGDAILRNSYYGPAYAKGGNKKFHQVQRGDTYRSRSSLLPPETPIPLMVTHMQGMPYMLDEFSYNRPNAYRAEASIVASVYGSLVGMDGWGLEGSFPASGWTHGMNVWDHASPTQIGQWPAAALAYRQGFIATADEVAVRDILSLEDLYAFKGASIYAGGGHDKVWVDIGDDAVRDENPSAMRVDPLAFFVGPVVRQIEETGPSRVESVDLDQYIDRQARTVTSLTKEIVWDYANGVMSINAPRAQGAVGFLSKRGRIALADLTLESGNDYASVLVVPLDGEPLARSRRILIQAVTEDRPYGFRTEATPEGFDRITELGSYPLNVRRIDQRLTLKRQERARVTILDENGYPTDRQARVTAVDGGVQINLPEDALYTLVEFP